MDIISLKGNNFALRTKGPVVVLENNGRTAVEYGGNDGELVDVEYRYNPSTSIEGDLLFHCPGRTWIVQVHNYELPEFSEEKQTIEMPFSPKKWRVLVLDVSRHRIIFTMV